MAKADISSQLSNLNLGEFVEETERPEFFWNRAMIAMKFNVESKWLDAVWRCKTKPNYGMQNLDATLEERCLLKLELTGPLVDGYLREIGRAFAAKLGRSRNTGLMPPVKLFVPYTIFRHICTICVGYGGTLTCNNVKGQIVVKINSIATATKVFSPVRFGGDNFLRKRHYSKVKEAGRNILQYQGKAAVVVGEQTPILFEYSQKHEKATITFFVQRYDKDDFAMNLQLQALCNVGA